MKILKKIDVSNWNYKHTCTKCESELEVEPSDLHYEYCSGDMREPGYDLFTAKCAVCSFTFNIPIHKIPKVLQHEIKNKPSKSRNGIFDS